MDDAKDEVIDKKDPHTIGIIDGCPHAWLVNVIEDHMMVSAVI